MKLVLKNPQNPVNERLTVVKKEVPCLDASWHYHPEFELLYISKSSGIRFVGDSVDHFCPGDLVLVGPYLPHLWRNDPSFYEVDTPQGVQTIVTKFTRDFIGEGTFENPEFSGISALLKLSRFGVCFGEKVSKELHKELIELPLMSPPRKAISLLDLLYRLSLTEDRQVLSSTDMRQYTTENSKRIDMVLKFISDNYANYITLADVADLACMTTNSFCRFFKKMTNKSFTQFLNEVRVRNAARLLVQKDLPISDICYLVGYKSITNFNRQFKEIMGQTPNGYRRTM